MMRMMHDDGGSSDDGGGRGDVMMRMMMVKCINTDSDLDYKLIICSCVYEGGRGEGGKGDGGEFCGLNERTTIYPSTLTIPSISTAPRYLVVGR